MTETLSLKKPVNTSKNVEKLVAIAREDKSDFHKCFMEEIQKPDSYKTTISLFFSLLIDKNEECAFEVFNKIQNQQTEDAVKCFSNHFNEQAIEQIENSDNLEKLKNYLSKKNKIFNTVQNREKMFDSVEKKLKQIKKHAPKKENSKSVPPSQETIKSSVFKEQNIQKTKPETPFDKVIFLLKKIRSDYENLKIENKNNRETIEKFSSEKSNLSSKIEKLQNDVKDRDEEIENLKKEKAEIKRQKEVSEKRNEEILKEKEERIKYLEKEISEFKDANNFLKKEKFREKESFILTLEEQIAPRYRNYSNDIENKDNPENKPFVFIIDKLFRILKENGVNFDK